MTRRAPQLENLRIDEHPGIEDGPPGVAIRVLAVHLKGARKPIAVEITVRVGSKCRSCRC